MFDTPLSLFVFIFGWITTIITIACYIPQAIKTAITKNTTGISKWFFIFGFSCSVAWVILGISGIFSSLEQGSDISSSLLVNLPVVITNMIGLICQSIVLIYKIINVRNAKKNNMSETEYCNKFRKSKTNKFIDKL